MLAKNLSSHDWEKLHENFHDDKFLKIFPISSQKIFSICLKRKRSINFIRSHRLV